MSVGGRISTSFGILLPRNDSNSAGIFFERFFKVA
jgi:hypothetical protein